MENEALLVHLNSPKIDSTASGGLRVPARSEHQVARGLAPAVPDGIQAPPGVGHEVLERGVQGQRPTLHVQPDEKL